MHTRIVPVFALSCALAAAPLRAQTPTPAQVAGDIMAAVRATDWGRMATLMDTGALRQLHALLEPILTLDDPEVAGMRQTMFGFATLEAARAATDSAVFVGLMRFTTSQQAGLADAMRSAQFAVLGTVPEGRDTMHVVGRISLTVESIAVTNMEVISLVRAGATWRGLLKGDVTAMASALRRAVEGR
jgi:hypothetical protein